MSREKRGGDDTSIRAKTAAHGASRNDKEFEHEQITDNRLVWEVLEEGDNNNG